MALDKFVKTLWAARLLANLHKAHVIAQPGVVNRDYEGEARSGQTVKIGSIGPITVGTYSKNTDHAGPEALTDDERALVIDQQKMFNFQVDDVDRVQGNPAAMDEAMREAAYAIADVQDQFIAGLHGDADAANLEGSTTTPVALTTANAYTTLLRLRTRLNKSNVPTQGRYAILPPEWVELLLQDQRFISAGGEGRETIENGVVGRAAGFTIAESNNLAVITGGKVKALAGSPLAITMADQIETLEAYRPQARFADAVKGLQVYGAKVVRPKALAVATVTFA